MRLGKMNKFPGMINSKNGKISKIRKNQKN